MKEIDVFKAKYNTNRFKQNQKVWIIVNCANHLMVIFRYRGYGRYVRGIVDKQNKVIGDIKKFEVTDDFYYFLELINHRTRTNAWKN